MKKPVFALIVCMTLACGARAQQDTYLVSFTDKASSVFTISKPSDFLSQRAIERRKKYQIAIDETDLPVTARYVQGVLLCGKVQLINQSKWLNQISIEADTDAIAKMNSLPYVKQVRRVKNYSPAPIASRNKFKNQVTDLRGASGNKDLSYGNSFDQIHLHEGEYLHNAGFRGDDMLISVIDAGFFHYNSLPAFDSVLINGQIKDTRDFVKNKASVYEEDTHGMYCFSILAGNIPGKLVGSAPGANYLLYRSEDAGSEWPIEEQYWAIAAETSDSAGADLITTSLGYTTFDDPSLDHSYGDMDGRTTIVAKAAVIAARKGIIVLAAAGNDGNNGWHFISSPGDADSILTVGAVDIAGTPAAFSSYGPSADGRIKPTVASMGVAAVISMANGNIGSGNGTSFATPNLAGLVACLWQAYPEFNNMEIIDAVKKSASTYNNPNNRIGYGIPNFRIAYETLKEQRTAKIRNVLGSQTIKAYPNPVRGQFNVALKPANTGKAVFKLFDSNGKLVKTQTIPVIRDEPQMLLFDRLQYLPPGVYVLQYNDGSKSESITLIFK